PPRRPLEPYFVLHGLKEAGGVEFVRTRHVGQEQSRRLAASRKNEAVNARRELRLEALEPHPLQLDRVRDLRDQAPAIRGRHAAEAAVAERLEKGPRKSF